MLFFQSILGPLVQLPMFVSFFFGIRGMAYLPVESFKTGGYLWFQDLTLYDPYFVLPFICSFSMLASIEVHVNTLEIHCCSSFLFIHVDQLCSKDVTEAFSNSLILKKIHFEFRQKYSAVRHILHSLLGVWISR